jgi:hypothetical protein
MELIDWPRDYYFSRRILLHGVSYLGCLWAHSSFLEGILNCLIIYVRARIKAPRHEDVWGVEGELYEF